MTRHAFLVAGAGYTGSRLLAALPAGSAVGLRRSAGGADNTVQADLDEPGVTLPAARVVIYSVPPARHSDGDPRLQRFLDSLPEPPQRIVYFSTSGVYGDTGGAVVDEDAPLRPGTDRAKRRVAAEEILKGWCAVRDVELCVLRVPGIYGPGRLGIERLREGKSVLREADAGPGNRIHVDDLVRCALAAASRDRVPPVCNVGDGDERSSTAFSKAVAELAGVPAPTEISREAAAAELGDMRMSFLNESRRLDLARMREELGVMPLYSDVLDGIRASLRAEQDGA